MLKTRAVAICEYHRICNVNNRTLHMFHKNQKIRLRNSTSLIILKENVPEKKVQTASS